MTFFKSRISYRPYICYLKENPQKSLEAAPSDQAVHGEDACYYIQGGPKVRALIFKFALQARLLPQLYICSPNND
jgi:hypothetical protein